MARRGIHHRQRRSLGRHRPGTIADRNLIGPGVDRGRTGESKHAGAGATDSTAIDQRLPVPSPDIGEGRRAGYADGERGIAAQSQETRGRLEHDPRFGNLRKLKRREWNIVSSATDPQDGKAGHSSRSDTVGRSPEHDRERNR